jgi:hypothetical protein
METVIVISVISMPHISVRQEAILFYIITVLLFFVNKRTQKSKKQLQISQFTVQ